MRFAVFRVFNAEGVPEVKVYRADVSQSKISHFRFLDFFISFASPTLIPGQVQISRKLQSKIVEFWGDQVGSKCIIMKSTKQYLRLSPVTIEKETKKVKLSRYQTEAVQLHKKVKKQKVANSTL